MRRGITRISKQNMEASRPLLELLDHVALKKGATKAQIALAWMLERYPHVVPIPGARRLDRLHENLGATTVTLNAEELEELHRALATIEFHGTAPTRTSRHSKPPRRPSPQRSTNNRVEPLGQLVANTLLVLGWRRQAHRCVHHGRMCTVVYECVRMCTIVYFTPRPRTLPSLRQPEPIF